ncbi:uncharacterized protein LOC111404919 [Olea europaea var. sylvestris]|uniref:uncharacterized protein LOC111404919 n=1 Tax=Olea europaea var. sylvestris TaxID=158386 RepID=UPI000C1D05A5|nr:uncharacterized protein LOC111404919 [Olea europaea var. sylvestris]
MHKWKPKEILTDKIVKQYLSTHEIRLLAVLQSIEEELLTLWYTTLSLPLDNKHSILDGIADGELGNIVPQIPHNKQTINADDVGTSRTYPSVGVEPNYTSVVDYNYVTKEQMEEMFTTHRQYVSGLYDDLKARIKKITG